MRYTSIRAMDISNGLEIGISLFVQGCHFHCKNCFNKSTWDFNGGNEWTKDVENDFIELANKDYIKRISILGGEPLADENVLSILKLIHNIKDKYNDTKKIWIYTGYMFEKLFYKDNPDYVDFSFSDLENINYYMNNKMDSFRREVISNIDVLVDGLYIEKLKDIDYPFAGSTNQKVIDIKQTKKNNKLTLLKIN